MTVLLSLLGAMSYGLADFVGGVVSKRVSAWSVALTALAGGSVATLVAGLIWGSDPSRADLGWAVLGGLANGLGTAFLYRGLASGRMGVVAPVSGVGAAVLPVAVGVSLGERPDPLVWTGIALALPAIWLVAREPPAQEAGPAPGGGSGFTDGVLAGLGFGTLFVALSRLSEDAGILPLALNQAVAGVAVIVVASLLRAPWLPRDPRAAWGVVAGLLGATATVLFTLASQGGNLTIAAVVISLYPAFTVLLAALVVRERIHAGQAVGLGLCAVAVVLVAAG
jgi:drug/metabolite transporter (DMT)-like permease